MNDEKPYQRVFRPIEDMMQDQMSCHVCMGTGIADINWNSCGCPPEGYPPEPEFAKFFDLYQYLTTDMSADLKDEAHQ